MKKIISITHIILIGFLLSSTAFADTLPSTTTSPQQITAELQARATAQLQTMHAAETNAASIEKKAEDNHFASTTFLSARSNTPVSFQLNKNLDTARTHIISLFGNVTMQLQNLLDRIQSQITKLQVNGVDTTGAQAALDTTETNLQTANTDIATLQNSLATPFSTTTHETIIGELNSQSKQAKEDLISVRDQIISITKLLKTETATTTSTTSNEQ